MNLIRRRTGAIVPLDWAFLGEGAIGEDLGNHVPDGAFDLFVTNFSGENNALYLSDARRGAFRERSSPTGLGGPSRGFLGWVRSGGKQ